MDEQFCRAGFLTSCYHHWSWGGSYILPVHKQYTLSVLFISSLFVLFHDPEYEDVEGLYTSKEDKFVLNASVLILDESI